MLRKLLKRNAQLETRPFLGIMVNHHDYIARQYNQYVADRLENGGFEAIPRGQVVMMGDNIIAAGNIQQNENEQITPMIEEIFSKEYLKELKSFIEKNKEEVSRLVEIINENVSLKGWYNSVINEIPRMVVDSINNIFTNFLTKIISSESPIKIDSLKDLIMALLYAIVSQILDEKFKKYQQQKKLWSHHDTLRYCEIAYYKFNNQIKQHNLDIHIKKDYFNSIGSVFEYQFILNAADNPEQREMLNELEENDRAME